MSRRAARPSREGVPVDNLPDPCARNFSMSAPTLWQFRHSHFNEKVRWALDWKGIAHVRRSLVAGPHIPRVLWLTGQKQVPALVLDGEVLHDSTQIIAALENRWPTPALYPADGAERQ